MWHAYTHNGILLSLKREGNSDTCYNMDRSWRHAQWNNLVTKRQAAFYLVVHECPGHENHLEELCECHVFPNTTSRQLPHLKNLLFGWSGIGQVVFLQDPQGICSHDENEPCQLTQPVFTDHLPSTVPNCIFHAEVSNSPRTALITQVGIQASEGLQAPPIGWSSKL